MSEYISVEGIETNNLKNIDVTLEKKGINLIVGPSGSGKSSLAYDTIAQIGQHEFMAMYADDIAEPSYVIKDYHNMVAAIPVKQSNRNSNMHSTIGTYFGLNRDIAYIYAVICKKEESFFTLNKSSNLCEVCNGIGTVNALDENRIIDYSKSIADNPIRCWNRYTDFYKQILTKYCTSVGIDVNKNFRQLSIEERNTILYGKSEDKYPIKFKKKGRISSRTTKYNGVLTEQPMIPKFKPSPSFYSDHECSCCHGKKYSIDHDQYKVFDKSIGEFMITPFSDLVIIIEKLKQEMPLDIRTALDRVYKFITKAVELKLGHLYFHRAIPTLSGGEFQRLKLVQIFNTQLSDLLIVLDEPLAGLSSEEKASVYNSILKLSKIHTLLIVDHSDIFVPKAKKVYALGPGGGIYGGQLIDETEYLRSEAISHSIDIISGSNQLTLNIANSVYHYKGANISLLKDSMNLIKGSSGVGKSTLIREYFPQQWDDYVYIDQKPVEGNKNSNVATVLDIAGKIARLFEKKTGKDRRLFSNHTGNAGACPICNGSGVIEYGYNSRTRISLKCEECEGTGFNRMIKKYSINNTNIFDIWNMTLNEGEEFFSNIDISISKTLHYANELLLGHLKIGQATSTLSGGENTRIKIMKAAKTKCDIIGIDEPFRGLNNSEIYRVAVFLDQLRKKGKTIVVVDHSVYAEKFFARITTLKNVNEVLVGKSEDKT